MESYAVSSRQNSMIVAKEFSLMCCNFIYKRTIMVRFMLQCAMTGTRQFFQIFNDLSSFVLETFKPSFPVHYKIYNKS